MLRLIERLMPAALHRWALQVAHGLRHRYRMRFRPQLAGVMVFVRDSEERILLVRHSYGPQAWAIPGGGMRRGEDPLLAARREMAEELGIALTELALMRVEEEVLSGAPHSAYLVSARTSDQPRPDRREVVEVDYFALDALPEPLARVTRRRLDALEQR